MTVQLFVFYLLAAVAVASAVMVVSARNPVHSVLFLILAFFNSAGLFVLIGAEFLAMILVVVYVGAVAVLFMFVVMMLDINFVRAARGLRCSICRSARWSGWSCWRADPGRRHLGVAAATARRGGPAPRAAAGHQHRRRSGKLLYTHYFYLFQAAGMILLVAMIGAITLTLRHRAGVRRQDIGRQVSRAAGRRRRAAQGADRGAASDGDPGLPTTSRWPRSCSRSACSASSSTART